MSAEALRGNTLAGGRSDPMRFFRRRSRTEPKVDDIPQLPGQNFLQLALTDGVQRLAAG